MRRPVRRPGANADPIQPPVGRTVLLVALYSMAHGLGQGTKSGVRGFLKVRRDAGDRRCPSSLRPPEVEPDPER